MSWFLIALGAPALWGLVNHVDKYIIKRFFVGDKGVGSLVLFTAASGAIMAIPIGIFAFGSLDIGVIATFVIAVNGAILVASFIPYMYAIEHEEASFVTSLFQLIPVFTYLLAMVFLHEYLTVGQLFASALVVVGAVIISLDLTHTIRFKAKPFWLMVLSSFMLAVNALIFKVIALDANFWGTAFWEYVGGAIFGILLMLFIPLYRQQFIATIKKGGLKVTGVNFVAEIMNIIAKLLANFASLLAPLALVWVVNGFQPMLVFIYGVILTLFIPQWGKEDLSKKTIIQKLCAIAIIFAGVVLLLK